MVSSRASPFQCKGLSMPDHPKSRTPDTSPGEPASAAFRRILAEECKRLRDAADAAADATPPTPSSDEDAVLESVSRIHALLRAGGEILGSPAREASRHAARIEGGLRPNAPASPWKPHAKSTRTAGSGSPAEALRSSDGRRLLERLDRIVSADGQSPRDSSEPGGPRAARQVFGRAWRKLMRRTRKYRSSIPDEVLAVEREGVRRLRLLAEVLGELLPPSAPRFIARARELEAGLAALEANPSDEAPRGREREAWAQWRQFRRRSTERLARG